jgi:drug/metabolite transporter (DMT)-like permease
MPDLENYWRLIWKSFRYLVSGVVVVFSALVFGEVCDLHPLKWEWWKEVYCEWWWWWIGGGIWNVITFIAVTVLILTYAIAKEKDTRHTIFFIVVMWLILKLLEPPGP